VFYSRPKIDPLRWDLLALPVPQGSRNFEAITSDMRPVDFRFSGGWLTVERGPANSSPDSPDMQEVLSCSIAPFGIMDIEPKQICDILGLTVNGCSVDPPPTVMGASGFDWSGRTTYWQSTHMMQTRDDARGFIERLSADFPDAVLVQPAWGSDARVRCRRIKFLMDSDEVVQFGIRYHRQLLDGMLAAEEVSWSELEDVFTYAVTFSREERDSDDVTRARYIRSRGAAALDLRYDVVHHRRYRIRMEFPTADADAQAITSTILSILDDYFCRGLQKVDLRTGAVLEEEMRDEEDDKSYSHGLRDACAEGPLRYLFVGVHDEAGKEPVFFGARPRQLHYQA
jgi:hypothetical protein